MRFTYYVFPEELETSRPKLLLAYGCRALVKSSEDSEEMEERRCWPSRYEERKSQIEGFNREIHCSVRRAKKMMKKYGGSAYTMHCERDGTVFEYTSITLKGNNSKHRYNHHL